jgi:uncharacterized protein (TIRG00374 family)
LLKFSLNIQALLGVATHLLLPQITALIDSWHVLASMELWAVGLAFIAQVISYLGNGYLLQRILAIVLQEVTLGLSILIVLGSASIGMVAGGVVGSTAAIYRWTSGAKGNAEGAILASLFLPLFNNLMLIAFSIFGLVHLFLAHRLTQAQLIGFGAILLFLGLIIGGIALVVRYRIQAMKAIIWISTRTARLRRKSSDPKAIRQETAILFDAWDKLWKGSWHRPVVGAILNVTFDMLTLYFFFLAAGYHVNPGVLLCGYGLPLLLGKMAFIIPGGVGVVESSMAVLYTGLGVPYAIAVVVVLGYRLISFWIPGLAGFPIAAYLQRSQRKST